MPDPSDPVYACLQIETPCPVDETDTGKRCYRDVIDTVGQWSVGDTIITKLQTPGTNCVLFGFERSELGATDLLVKTSIGIPVSGTCTGLGTGTVTFTLTGTAPAGDTLTVCYRTGCPGVYVSLVENRGNADINLHSVDIDNPLSYVEVYGREHTWSGDPNMPDILRVTGMGLQTNPPT